MVYELRSWFDDAGCLFTDDERVRDLAVRSPRLQITSRYFRGLDTRQPFAWDIVGDLKTLSAIAGRFGGDDATGARRGR